jgi:hypothetical protein
MSSEGAQRVKVQLTALQQKTQTEHHVLRDDLRRLVAAGTTKPLKPLQEDLKELHAASTPCRGLHRMRPRLFCQPSCRHTETWESCPNQIPQWIWSGVGDPTEEAVGVTQDASAHFLRGHGSFTEWSEVPIYVPGTHGIQDLLDQSSPRCQNYF